MGSLSVGGRALCALAFFAVCICAARGSAEFDVRAFGAKGDGATKDTAAVQRALDACAQAGGGRVTVPPGTYLVGSVYLGDRTELHLKEGATLLGSPDLADYNAPDAYPQNWCSAKEGWSAKHLVLALEKHGVSITGRGVIDGNARAFFDDKPQLVGKVCWRDGGANARVAGGRPGQEIVFIECRDVAVRDVTLRDMSCWSCFFHGCENVTVGGVTVRNDITYLNTDGIDVDSCRNVEIGDCDIVTGDDAITVRGSSARLKNPAMACENVRVSNIVCRVSADGMRVGVGSGTIRNVRVSDMKVERGGRGIHVQCFFGNSHPKGVDISDVSFERISIRDVVEAVNVGVGAPGAARLENIRFREVAAEGGSPSLVCGTRAVRVKGVTFTDCSFNVAGPAAAKGEVFRIERADAVSFHNCKFNGVQGADARRLFSVRDAATINF
jgi:polygalacturonase